MNVLMITGDKNLLIEGSSAHQRLELQRSAVEKLDVVYWGRGSLWSALKSTGKYDVVTAQDPLWRGLVALYLAKKIRVQLNIQVHMDLSHLSLFTHVVSQIVLRRADSIRVVSQRIKEQVERLGVRAKITALPMFIDISRFKNTVRPHTPPHTHKTIIWIGRFEEEKDPQQALSILKKVGDAGIDARLIMLGSGSLEERLRREALRHGHNVVFEGWQDPASYLAIADVAISTSKYESWGASIIEALASGVPVVAPDVGVAKEAGAIVVPRERLAEAVIDVLKSGEQGVLKLNLLSAPEWALQWRNSLI